MNEKFIAFFIVTISVMFVGTAQNSFAEDFVVSIPYGAFNPELNTPAEVWYDPPELSITVGDTVTWTNDDREGHTVTSGYGAGRFDWMDTKNLGEADGLFDSLRFMPGESWSYTFEKEGSYNYFCVIHPWMEAIIFVDPYIPDFPHDATGKKYESFPTFLITPDRSVEINFSWEPQVIKTHEKVNFIYRFYDAVYDQPLRKLEYDIAILQNNEILYKDEKAVSGAGGDYRQWIFEEPGPIIVKISNIKPYGQVAESQINLSYDATARLGDFTAMVYDNPEKRVTTDKIVQPRETLQFYYEIAVAIIVVPVIMLAVLILYMKTKKNPPSYPERKASPV
ncbi:Plastocyanin protein [Marine Group I thaumarchaeote SCGC AAA799-E16]|uniref:Plastocyanin protein n=3 Tax=Marine Group I TaxID=905826 RepID=A0A087RRS2_9ARCH|nr:Plastocyanin protein [Marine Group I thaumarchaeote SCGC AAA799-E16]KFM16176.1 Plastocyanin protein [Marine Group I thaumarchaeote SCGC AAA799-D11]KFM16269.1 Plastocyanin protein [Marine Group I thaumarchaeote SCGC RSA3]